MQFQQKRSWSRGKLGKASRSSSQAPAVSSLAPSFPASSISSPSAQDSSDPFQAFREGYIPPPVIPLLASSMPSSRASFRALNVRRGFMMTATPFANDRDVWSTGAPAQIPSYVRAIANGQGIVLYIKPSLSDRPPRAVSLSAKLQDSKTTYQGTKNIVSLGLEYRIKVVGDKTEQVGETFAGLEAKLGATLKVKSPDGYGAKKHRRQG
ncbi:hypothetical protein FRC05_009598 [Tulasnella sp. 425]|nr:hypothetical protein FRC05_009598 [Tulasnella sp. 425]